MMKYISLFRIRFIGGLQYRTAALGGIATQFAWGFLTIFAFHAFYKSNPGVFSMEFSALCSYVWLQQAFLMLFAPWVRENSILSTVMTGQIAYEMARPLDLYNKWYFEAYAGRFSKTALRCAPVLIIAALLGKPFGMGSPQSLQTFMLFIPAFFLASAVVVAYTLILYVLTLKTINSSGLFFAASFIADFLAGAYIPLSFFPPKIKFIAELLPFGSMQNLPLRIYGGDIAGAYAVRGILLQVFWLFALILTGKVLMQKAIKKVVVQGG